jgi:hypothetical protein
MDEQPFQDVTLRQDWLAKLKQFLGKFWQLSLVMKLARWATYAYVAQAAAGFSVGLALPWVRLFTK